MSPGNADASGPAERARVDGLSALDGDYVDGVRLRRDGLAYLGDVSRSGGSTSLAVVEMVAAVLERPVTELPPLYDTVEPEDLDTLCEPGASTIGKVRVIFHYEGFRVTVHGSGRIELARE